MDEPIIELSFAEKRKRRLENERILTETGRIPGEREDTGETENLPGGNDTKANSVTSEESRGNSGGDRDISSEALRLAGGESSKRKKTVQSGNENPSAETTRKVRKEAESFKQNTPRLVSKDNVSPIDTKGIKINLDNVLAAAWGGIYHTISLVYGPHWNLEDREALELGKASAQCSKLLPPSVQSNLEKKLDKYFPWASLIMTAYTITYPRVMVNLANDGNSNNQNGPTNNPRPSVSNSNEGLNPAAFKANAFGANRTGFYGNHPGPV